MPVAAAVVGTARYIHVSSNSSHLQYGIKYQRCYRSHANDDPAPQCRFSEVLKLRINSHTSCHFPPDRLAPEGPENCGF
jgi:hypothetical protein